jgi:methylmalonyl-CoA/ethylmalonyl-CoA epimerase
LSFHLSRIGQIALSVGDVDRAEAFYRDTLGLKHLYRFGDLTFFDCAGVRLMLQRAEKANGVGKASPIYFSCPDIAIGVATLNARGVEFTHPPARIAEMEDHDLWMAFFEDPDGHTLALMSEAPRGYALG